MAEQAKTAHGGTHGAGETRRDFLYLAAGAIGGVGAAVAAWPLINSMNPSADVLALATVEVDLAPIAEGQRVTVKWQGKPVFLDHRTPKQIDEARAVPLDQLRDPETDEQRAIKPDYLVMVGICTHLGCIPKGQRVGDPLGEFGGWFCPCHGSHYDTAGRIRKGPAPRNLLVPPYAYLTESRIVIGQTEEGA